MRKAYGAGVLMAMALALACDDSTEPDGDDVVPTDDLVFARLEPGVTIPTRDTSFVVTAGERFELELFTDPEPGDDDGQEFFEFEVDEETLLRRPNGTLFQPGDTITIRVTVPGNAYVFHFEPSGLQFNPDRPAELKISYADADDDFDDDGDTDDDDVAFESDLTIWRQQVLGGDWERLGASVHSIESDEIEFDVEHFTGFALAGNRAATRRRADPMNANGLLRQARERYLARDYVATAALLEQADAARRAAQPELAFLLAASWRQLGRAAESLELATAITDDVLLRGTPRLALRRVNLEGMLRFESGAVADAEALWQQLHGHAAAADDAEYVAHACNNLGVVYTLQTRRDEALASYERALVAYQRMGERLGLGQAHHNLGITYREADRPEHADQHFEAARNHATAATDDRLLGRVEAERALLHARIGDSRLAEAAARRARSRLQLVGDRAGTGEALRATGLIAIAAGRPADAVEPLEQAVEIGRATGHALLEAEALLGLSFARGAGSETARAEAAAIFERIGAIQWGRAMERWIIDPKASVD